MIRWLLIRTHNRSNNNKNHLQVYVCTPMCFFFFFFFLHVRLTFRRLEQRIIRNPNDFLPTAAGTLPRWHLNNVERIEGERRRLNGIFECALENTMANLLCSQVTTAKPGSDATPVVAEELHLLKREHAVCTNIFI
jgi:hypothetical protein